MSKISPEAVGELYETEIPNIVRYLGSFLDEDMFALGFAAVELWVGDQAIDGTLPSETEAFRTGLFCQAHQVLSGMIDGIVMPEAVADYAALVGDPWEDNEQSRLAMETVRSDLAQLPNLVTEEVLVLRFLCDFPLERVSRILGMEQQQVADLQAEGLSQLRRVVAEK